MLRIALILAALFCSSNAFAPTPFVATARRAPAASDTRLFEKTEAKILLKAPELPREDDGLVHLPTVPLLAAGLALFVSTGFKMRDNRMKTAVKREENSKQLLEDVKAYNAAKKAAD